MKIGVMASHEGTTLQAVLNAALTRAIPVEVAVVVSNNSESGALRRAREAGVEAVWLSSRTHPEPDALDLATREAFVSRGVELVLLAGYMKKLGPRMLGEFQARIVNTHPALLPKFGGQGMYGMRVHRAVLAAKEPTTGVSIHLVDAEYDHGPVIAQAEVPVDAADSPELLAERVQQRERAFLVEILGKIAGGRLRLDDPATWLGDS